jgi:hypothetical protein
MRTLDWRSGRWMLTLPGLLLLVCSSVQASERCVDASGKGGCSTTIGAAVAAPAAHHGISGATGVYQ